MIVETVGISLSRESDANTLHVTDGAADLRRAVGPVAWFVLECLALNAVPTVGDDGWVVVTNVRAIAVACGIGKDRAASALRALRDTGLVAAASSDRPPGARFEPARYRIHLPAPIEAPAMTSTAVPRTSPRARDRVANPTLFASRP